MHSPTCSKHASFSISSFMIELCDSVPLENLINGGNGQGNAMKALQFGTDAPVA